VAALSIPVLGWYIYQDTLLGFGAATAVWRWFAIGVSTVFLALSWTVLPTRPRLALAAHAVLLSAPVINAAGLTVMLFLLRPDVPTFQAGTRGALFITIFVAFVFAAGTRRWLWLLLGLPLTGMCAAAVLTGAFTADEWPLFSDVGVALVVVSVVAFQQERLHFDEFQLRIWAAHRKDALEANLRELRQLNRQLREFAYLVSHDLKEPLRTVSGLLALAEDALCREPPDTARVREVLALAQNGSGRMSRLMDGLLAYSRVDTTASSHRAVALDDVLAEVEANLRAAITESEAVIQRSPLPSVMGDHGQLVQLFQNLVSNALKYHRPGAAPEVTIRAEDHGDRVAVLVSDYGIGIDPQHHERIFRLFQRLHTSAEYEGSGVGLALVRRIVERHGGEVSVESALDAGATFRVTLPRG
jgi:signal transduction histidine kinase